MVYVCNNVAIVRYAKYCYKEFPTIVNNIPKEKNHYNNTMEDFALIDNKLGNSQRIIGQSSNLAQLCLSYSYNDWGTEFKMTACILAVVAQAAIDSAKRQFCIDLPGEIKRIKEEMHIKDLNHYPVFWKAVEHKQKKKKKDEDDEDEEGKTESSDSEKDKKTEQDQDDKSKSEDKKNGNDGGKGKISVNRYQNPLIEGKYDPDMICPMNVLYEFKPKKYYQSTPTLPDEVFFNNYELKENRRKCRKVEEMIQKYSWDLYQYNVQENDVENYWILEDQFKKLIADIRSVHISNNYLGLMSYLINRALNITSASKGKKNVSYSKLCKNQAFLMKTLYEVSPQQFLQCWSKNVNNEQNSDL